MPKKKSCVLPNYSVYEMLTARQEIECKSCVFGSPDKIRDKRARVMENREDKENEYLLAF